MNFNTLREAAAAREQKRLRRQPGRGVEGIDLGASIWEFP